MKKKYESSNSVPNKLDRKTVEKNRRMHMKSLCFKLASVVPPHFYHSKDMMVSSQQDHLDNATSYIKELRERIEKLKKRKQQLASVISSSTISNNINSNTSDHGAMNIMHGLRLPVVELREIDSSIEVILISGLQKNFMLHEVISVLEEEAAEVVSANLCTIGDKIFHTIHAQVKISRVGVETARVCQRLQELVHHI